MAKKKDEKSVIYKWLVDYMLHIAWQELKTSHTLEQFTIDLIAGLFGMDSTGEDMNGLIKQKLLIVIMCQIVDGQNISAQYVETSEAENEEATQTPLEDMLRHFAKLVGQQSDKNLIDKGNDLMIKIKVEAVLACCRAEDFKQAMEIFKRQFSDFDKTNKYYKLVQELQKKIQAKQKSSNAYDKFVDSIVAYIDKIMAEFEEPLLIQAATCFLAEDHSIESPRKRSQKRLCHHVSEQSEDKTECQNGDSLSPQKLRKVWGANVKEMFGCSAQKQKATSSTTEVTQASMVLSDQSTTGKSGSSSNNFTLSTVSMQEKPDSSTLKSPHRPKKQCKNGGKADSHKAEIPIKTSSSCTISVTASPPMTPKRKRWTEEEKLEFYYAVKKFRVGQWAQIKDFLGTQRTAVMLKDKWRTMLNSGDVQRLSTKKHERQTTRD